MRALSVSRPWAHLIFQGKNVENRTWLRWLEWGRPLLIHAAKSWDDDAIEFAREVQPDLGRLCDDPDHHPTGVVGVVDFISVCSAQRGRNPLPCSCGPWAMPGQFHWRLANPRPLPEPVPCRGMPGLFTPPDNVLAEIARQLNGSTPGRAQQ